MASIVKVLGKYMVLGYLDNRVFLSRVLARDHPRTHLGHLVGLVPLK